MSNTDKYSVIMYLWNKGCITEKEAKRYLDEIPSGTGKMIKPSEVVRFIKK